MKPILSFLAIAAAVACADSFTPTTDSVAGDYTLQRLTTVTDTGGTKEWVPLGATLTISLETNGTTTGRLFVPGGGEQGADFEADMAGTWVVTAGFVEFDQTADSFVRDFPFTARRNSLTAGWTSSGVRVFVALTK